MGAEKKRTEPTPGPWKVDGPFAIPGGGRVLEIGAETRDGHLSVASVGCHLEEEEQSRADAALIAAAPDLLTEHVKDLESLKPIALFIEGEISRAEARTHFGDLLKAKVEVIEKATGSKPSLHDEVCALLCSTDPEPDCDCGSPLVEFGARDA